MLVFEKDQIEINLKPYLFGRKCKKIKQGKAKNDQNGKLLVM